MNPDYAVTESEKSFQDDIDYISKDIVARQKNGLLCKYSRLLNEITVVDMEDRKYINYWVEQYKKDISKRNTIKELVYEKLNNGLTPLEDVIDMQKKNNTKFAKDQLERITSKDIKSTLKKDEEDEEKGDEEDE